MSHHHEKLIQELFNCAIVCEKCENACLSETDIAMMRNCITLDRDCADICILTARLLQRDSKVGHHLLNTCEEICRMCAEECDKHSHMEHCKECAEVCKKCADACRSHLEMA